VRVKERRGALEVRPRHEDDGSRAERQEQHDAEVEFYSLPSLLSLVHLNETSGATARARCSRSGLRIMSLSAELILKCWRCPLRLLCP
jgi:hypothetical protein